MVNKANVSQHGDRAPLSIQTTRAMEEYLRALTHGPDSARDKFEKVI